MEDRLEMREGAETGFTVVTAHAGGTDAAERQVVLGDVIQRVVDADAAGDGPGQHLVDQRAILLEQIQRQRVRMRRHIGDCLLQRVIRQQRQQRAEDLLLHHVHAVVDVAEQLRRQQPAVRVVRRVAERVRLGAAGHRSIAQADQTLVLAIGDDAGVLGALRPAADTSWSRSAGRLDELGMRARGSST